MASITEQTQRPAALALPSVAPADWLIRASLAGTFLYHGLTKFPALVAGAEMMGLPVWLWTLVAIVETAAGLGLLVGGALRTAFGDVVTRLSGLGIGVTMVGAIYLVHWGQWSNVPSDSHPFGGMEFQTLLVATGLFFALRGNRR